MDLSKVKVLEEFKGTDNLEFRVVEWDATLLEDLKVFCETCKQQGMKNNESTKALKFGKWGDQENWWFVYHGDKIISMSGAHYLPHIHKDCYMINYRLATLKEYRGCASAKKNTRMLNCFGYGKMITYQIDWCLEKKATDCVVTHSSEEYSEDNSGTMHKAWKLAKKYYPIDNKLTLMYEDYPLYGIRQDVWRFNVRDFNTLEPINYGDKND